MSHNMQRVESAAQVDAIADVSATDRATLVSTQTRRNPMRKIVATLVLAFGLALTAAPAMADPVAPSYLDQPACTSFSDTTTGTCNVQYPATSTPAPSYLDQVCASANDLATGGPCYVGQSASATTARAAKIHHRWAHAKHHRAH